MKLIHLIDWLPISLFLQAIYGFLLFYGTSWLVPRLSNKRRMFLTNATHFPRHSRTHTTTSRGRPFSMYAQKGEGHVCVQVGRKAYVRKENIIKWTFLHWNYNFLNRKELFFSCLQKVRNNWYIIRSPASKTERPVFLFFFLKNRD